MTTRITAALVPLAAAACSPGAPGGNATPAVPAAQASDTAPYYASLPLNELMPHVMQYVGDGIWKRQGYRTDRTGEHSLFPRNDQEWEDAESAGRTLAEVSNTLLVPGRRIPEPGWDNAVVHVRTVALKAAAAAEKHDKDAFFAAGSELDEACDDCHVRYDPTFRHKPK